MQILRVHLERRQLPLASDVSVASLASFTTGFTVRAATCRAGAHACTLLTPLCEYASHMLPIACAAADFVCLRMCSANSVQK